MEDQGNDIVDEAYEVPAGNTVCDHIYKQAPSDPNSNMLCAECTKCFHGCSYDPQEVELRDGQLIKKGQ